MGTSKNHLRSRVDGISRLSERLPLNQTILSKQAAIPSKNAAPFPKANTTGTKATGGGGPAYTMADYAFTPDATSGLQAAIQSGAGPH